MKDAMRCLFCWFWMLWMLSPVQGATCPDEDFTTRVASESGCLLMRVHGASAPATLVVLLHGNVSTGGPANSHFRVAEKMARDLAADRVTVAALVRPGYPDGTGAASSGDDQGRVDNWQRSTVEEIADVVDRLKQHFKPDRLVLVGHSGGAAISAVLLGLRPALAGGALLIGCPCDMRAWRAGRRGTAWLSEDPLRWVDRVAPGTRVLALTGEGDTVTVPALGESYVRELRARGVAADFEAVAGAGHVDVLGAPAITSAVRRLLVP